jgi:hypothetical protein
MERIGDVVLPQLPRAPARHIQEAIVQGEVDVGHQGRDGAEVLQDRREPIGVRRLRRDLDDLADRPRPVLPIPEPHGGGEILQGEDHPGEPVGLRRIVGRSELQDHLMLRPQIQALHVAPPTQIPDVQAMAVAPVEEGLHIHPLLHHAGRAPLAGDHHVIAQMPPEIVGQKLRPPIHLPAPQDLERVMVKREDPAGSIPLGVPQGADVDPIGPAVNRVRPRVARPGENLLRLDHLHQARAAGVRLGVHDVEPGRAQPGEDQVAALDVGMGRVRAQGRAAGVPAEMMQLIAGVRQLHPPDHLPVGRGTGIHIHHRQGVGPPVRVRVHRRHVGQALRGRLHGEPRGRIEAGVGLPEHHRSPPEGLGIHGDLAEPAGAHVVNEAADGVFMEQEGAGLKPPDGLPDILL